ncbi:MAG: hypothetical protein KF752_20875 [Pirellulaceae bacterium]|nr:hypothetical protein [Pirellulaceae bacterium]
MNQPTPNPHQHDWAGVNRPRPNPAAPYQCGLSGLGTSCALGPTASGQCCQQQWVVQCGDKACATSCTGASQCPVSQLKHSGCEEDRQDYQPCLPIKNVWYRRNSLALNLAILASGVLLVWMALPVSEAPFVPGGLSTPHAQILENTLANERCSLCHPPTQLFTTTVTHEQLCMKCHAATMPAAVDGNPHDLPPEVLVKLVAARSLNLNPIDVNVAATSSPLNHLSKVETTRCAQCHTEHQGSGHDLKAITDVRCQSCHQQRFTSFSADHPEFTQFPQQRERRIAFDHRAHFEKYFAQKNTTYDCKICHQVNLGGGVDVTRTVSFQAACASCHDQPLRAAAADGWAILQLPSLHRSDVQSGDPQLAKWPQGAQYGYDGVISFPLWALLASDPQVASALATFPHGDLSQATPSNPNQVAAMRTIAAGLRRLLLETAVEGQSAWQRRLVVTATEVLGRQLSVSENSLVEAMVVGLPPDLFRHVDSHWFGDHSSLASIQQSQVPVRLVGLQDLLLLEDAEDNESPEDLLRGSSTQGLKYQQQSGKSSQQAPTDILDAGSDTTESVHELLSQPLNERSRQQGVPPNAPSPETSQEPAIAVPGEGSDTKSTKVPKLIGAKHLFAGGWYLDSQLFALRYMASGHGDPVIAAWLQYAALVAGAERKETIADGTAVGTTLLRTVAAGMLTGVMAECRQCHLPAQQHNLVSSPMVWKGLSSQPAKRLTRFDHRPHLMLSGTADCRHCHRLNEAAAEGYTAIVKLLQANDATALHFHQVATQQHFQSDFRAMEKSQCTACHRQGGAPQGCTQCHDYHIGPNQLPD